MADEGIEFTLLMDVKTKQQYEEILFGKRKQKREPTHILGYKIGALYRGKRGTSYEGILARIEFWHEERSYEYHARKRLIPLVYENKETSIEYNGKFCNTIGKVQFMTQWELVLPSEPEPEVIEI